MANASFTPPGRDTPIIANFTYDFNPGKCGEVCMGAITAVLCSLSARYATLTQHTLERPWVTSSGCA